MTTSNIVLSVIEAEVALNSCQQIVPPLTEIDCNEILNHHFISDWKKVHSDENAEMNNETLIFCW